MIINTDTLSWPTYKELDTGVFSPKCSMPTIPFPQMLRDPHGRGGWNTVRARGGKKLQTRNQCFPDKTGQLCTGTHRDCDITLQGQYKLKPDKILAWKGSWEVHWKLYHQLRCSWHFIVPGKVERKPPLMVGALIGNHAPGQASLKSSYT